MKDDKATADKAGAPAVPGGINAASQPRPKEPVVSSEAPAKAEDTSLDAAVDDIAANDSDKLLEAEDKEVAAAFEPKGPQTKWQKVKAFFVRWWANKKARYATLSAAAVLLLGLGMFPVTRYFFLNTVGVRSSASLTVLDQTTQQPLKNVQVSLAGQSATTDNDGRVRLQKLKLGRSTLRVERTAFAVVDKPVTVGWGSNPLGEFKLNPVGAQYTFKLTDFLSDKPVAKVEASSGEASAFSDESGKLVLTLDKSEASEVEVTIKAEDYRTETYKLNVTTKDEQQVKLVPGRKHVFVSKRSGKFDVYKIDVDGTSEQLVLSGSGSERDDMVLVPHPTSNVAALVSTRDNQRNSDGFLLSTLTLLNLGEDNASEKIVTSERIQVVGWIGDRLIYVQVAAGTSAGNPKRHRLMSYNALEKTNKEIASSNYFNDVMIADDAVYYAPSAAYQNGIDVSLFMISADGSNRQTVFARETWNIFRTDYTHLSLAIQQDWYEYTLSDNKPPVKQSGAPANPKNRVYIDSPDKKQSIWIDERDGKGVLLAYNVAEAKDTILKTQSGLKYPARWVGKETVVYRIHTDQETADYVMSVSGGEARKIRDVTNTGGIDQWYYY